MDLWLPGFSIESLGGKIKSIEKTHQENILAYNQLRYYLLTSTESDVMIFLIYIMF